MRVVSHGYVNRTQVGATSEGLIVETGHPTLYASFMAPSTQTVYGALLGLSAGDSVTGIVLRNSTAAAGTLPTTARFGIADSTGKILAISANLNALASWPVGAMQCALTTPLPISLTGGYYACFVVNGVWGTTQPTPARAGGTAASTTAVGTAPPAGFSWAGQADLPAVNSSLTLTSGMSIDYYLGFY